MNSKMTTNSQLSTNEPKKIKERKKQKTKQTISTGTESEMDITWRDFSGEGEERNGGDRYRKEEA